MPTLRRSGGTCTRRDETVCAPIDTVPPWTSSKPATIRRSVVLPHPDGPRIATNSSSLTSRVTRLSTSTAPKRFVTSPIASDAIPSSRPVHHSFEDDCTRVHAAQHGRRADG